MFVIAGTRGFKKVLGTKVMHCQRCQNMTEYMYIKYTKWFTLFFIPIFPYSFKYFLVCPICSASIEMTSEQFDEQTTNNSIY